MDGLDAARVDQARVDTLADRRAGACVRPTPRFVEPEHWSGRVQRARGRFRSRRSAPHRRAEATLAILAALALAGCRGGAEPVDNDTAVRLTPQSFVIAGVGPIQSGPSISGSLQPRRQATIRAEVGGTVLQTFAEEGQRVSRGAQLARIEDVAQRDAQISARSAVRSAEQQFDVAQRDLERVERLAAAGAVAQQEVERAGVAVSTARAQLDDARARLALANEQLEATRVPAPIAGIVSDRSVAAGDVVQPGAALFTIVDPSSMRLEAAVPAARLTRISIGAPVEFTVTGYPGRAFIGEIERINPAADPATGQVEITVSIPNAGGDLVAGLFADGRVGAETATGLVLPDEAVDETGATPTVLRVKNGVVERVAVQLGLRDEQAERVQVTAGIMAGDTVLIGAARAITPGTPIEVAPIEGG